MNSLRVFAVSALFIGTMSVFSACGSDDDDGAGGKKGTGGKDSGLGGSGGVGATGATGGSGGVGLSGGNGGTTGGTGGTTGGTGGGGGSAGATGGAAGGGGTAGGAAGSAGTSSGGSAGSAPDAAAFGVCKETCTTSADCGGTNVCQLGECHAANNFPEKCGADADCIAEASGWTIPCTSTANCSTNFVCVDTGDGVGKCAALSTAVGLCVIQPATFDMPKIDGTGNVEVCGDNAGLLCHPVKKTCETPCTASVPDCFAQPTLKACVNGFCGCGSNANCASGFCDTATGICGCDASTDCPSSNPTCSGNKCGCNGVGECTKEFTSTTLSCN